MSPLPILRGALAVGVLALASGCVARVGEPVAYAEADYVPATITTYPSTVYEGRTVYYYGDRWYYRDGGRWAYYRHEPAPLYRRRAYVQAAPPAPRVYAAPPPYSTTTTTSAPVHAPPAVRVR